MGSGRARGGPAWLMRRAVAVATLAVAVCTAPGPALASTGRPAAATPSAAAVAAAASIGGRAATGQAFSPCSAPPGARRPAGAAQRSTGVARRPAVAVPVHRVVAPARASATIRSPVPRPGDQTRDWLLCVDQAEVGTARDRSGGAGVDTARARAGLHRPGLASGSRRRDNADLTDPAAVLRPPGRDPPASA